MDNLKILNGSSVALPDLNEEENETIEKESSIEYDMLEIIDNIGKPDFKYIYLNFIDRIKTLSIPKQRDFCYKIIEKIGEVYEYEISPIPEVDHPLAINEIYEFVEFLNYDYIEFFGDVWRYLNKSLRKLQVTDFCMKNGDKVISEIEDQLESRDLPELIANFLRTYNKSNMLGWFIEKTIESRILILLQIIEGVKNE